MGKFSNSNTKTLFTSESVTEGHPDKVCDQVSDAILDACLAGDKNSRVACECFAGKDFILIGGEINSNATIDYEKIARDTINKIGYNTDELGFNSNNIDVVIKVNKQSSDIALGTNDEVNGAGDQGMMFGYACNETTELMPLAISLAHKTVKKLAEQRKNGTLAWARPDGKAQVSVIYEGEKPVGIDTILISTQHEDSVTNEQIRKDLIENVIKPVFNSMDIKDTKILINPTGRFVIGGPVADTGLTGRKIIVDTYGGVGRHGGGAFSGKDATKVDRSGAYMARYIAKNIVASGIADKCEIQLAYAIGKSQPVSIHVNTFNTSKVHEDKIVEAIEKSFDLTPLGIIKKLSLRSPIFKQLASYGHVGRDDIDLNWEKTDAKEIFEALLNQNKK